MLLEELLNEFYTQNGIPENGGVDDDTFEMKALGLTLKLPNPKFRREALHIHDIQHVLNGCDTSWEGEGFISGWEISTGMWKYFPLGFLSLWAMGYSLWLHPKSVFNGFKKGLTNTGVIDLKKTKNEFMQMSYDELRKLTSKKYPKKFRFINIVQFLFWSFLSQVTFLGPLIILASGILFFFY